MRRTACRLGILTAVAAAAALAPRVRAQEPIHRPVEVPGFDFRRDGVWRVRARQVARARAAALARGDFAALNAPSLLRAGAPAPSPMAVSGTLRVPAILFRFHDTDASTTRSAAQYDATLFGASPPAGTPYTYRGFYDELSGGLLDIVGKSYGWYTLAGNMSRYVGPATGCTPYGTCNGFWSRQADSAMRAGLVEAVVAAGSAVDWSQYDNDGPDGLPNSGDDDGVADLTLFIQPAMDGSCRVSATNNDPWAHRSYLGVLTSVPSTGHPGRFITVGDFILQSGVGGATGCDSTRMMAIGIVAHETGHGLGLPDLYDYSLATQGVGHWSLMGYGNWSTPASPSHMDAWCLNQLGWVTLRPLARAGTYAVGPIETSDTALLVRPAPPNPRGEFYLLENRQGLRSDSALIRIAGPGLLAWHGDSSSFVWPSGSSPNDALPHALALVQADDLGGLDCASGGQCNRGDAGDPYPGSSGNTVFDALSAPAATLNAGGPAGFRIDSIMQIAPAGAVRFRLAFGSPTVVSGSDTAATIEVDGVRAHVFHDILADGSTHTIAADSFQATARAHYLFLSWSDGGARSHTIVGSTAGGVYTANLQAAYLARYATSGPGRVTASQPVDTASGTFFAAGDTLTLAAHPDSGLLFGGWLGDTVTLANPLFVRMSRPFAVVARFEAPLVLVDTVLRAAVMGAAYADTIRVAGTAGSYAFRLAGGALPPGLGLDSTTGIVSGIPTGDGTYDFYVNVGSLLQNFLLTLRLRVTTPVLSERDVAHQLLGRDSVLTADQLRYLDLVGNRNGSFDVGDFAAWLDRTGAAGAALPAATAAPPRGPPPRHAARRTPR